EFALAAEEFGLDSFWVWDHLQRQPAAGEADSQGMLECFLSLAGVAAITKRVLLGQLVAAVPYRNPALTAKMGTTLAHMSHGRAVLGLGAGWDRREMTAYGYQFEDAPTRLKRLEEAVQVVLKLWSERPASFQGHFYSLDTAYNDPWPEARPPLMVGGSGEKVTLRICAQYADWCNVNGLPEQVQHRFDVLRAHCERLGRDPDTIIRSNLLWAIVGRTQAEADAKRERLGNNARPFPGVVGDPERLVATFKQYEAAGSQHCIVQLTGENDPEIVRLIGQQVMSALHTG
ncbi:MAG TPA: TIGR03560 family F420-dependent LLM class oxidoreductase, partial [Chloroflexota bacterium]|nr:TIGR03560 family F420-dependent LLM class oxidoreductase [Chloroflexota bacterium]